MSQENEENGAEDFRAGDEITGASQEAELKYDEFLASIVDEFEKTTVVREEIDESEPTQGDVALQTILDSLTKVDFWKKVGPGCEKITMKHEIVIVVDEVLRVAPESGYGLCANMGSARTYNRKYWVQIAHQVLENFLREAAIRVGVSRIDATHHRYQENLRKQFLAAAYRPTPEIPFGVCRINVSNGTYEFGPDGHKLREFRQSDMMTYKLEFEYDELATCPQWEVFIDRMLPDKSSQFVLAEFLAYVFTTMKLERVLMLFGTGANGKSVVFEVVKALLGKQNMSYYALHSLGDKHNRAALVGKLLNYSSEASTKLETDLFKKLSSGEPCDARQLYGNSFTMENYCRFAFNSNELPKDVEHTHAFFRRFLILPFDVTIPEAEQDPELANKIIKTELPGVFNWILLGLGRLLSQGKFSHCEAAQRMTAQYQKESDTAAQFLEDTDYKATRDDQSGILLKEIYACYKSYCYDSGFRPLNCQNFNKRLKGLGIGSKRTKIGVLVFAVKG